MTIGVVFIEIANEAAAAAARDHITFTHYASDKPWATPIERYPFLADGDVSPVLWSLHRQIPDHSTTSFAVS